MAKIIDPDDLTQDVEVFFHTATKEIELVTGATLTTDGVTLQCVYSFSKERWKVDSELIKYPFPYIAITAEQFELVDGWNWATGITVDLIRDGGWALKNISGVTSEEWMNLTTLGTFNDPNVDTAYYQQEIDGVGTSTVYSGEVNQAIKIYGDATHGNIDYKDFFKIFLREQGKLYSYYDLMDSQNLSTLTYKKYALPLSNAIDLKITADDTTIANDPPYTGMTIEYFSSGQTRNIGGSNYDFSIIVDGNAGTAEEIYSFVAYELRQLSDIDAGPGIVSGYTADELMEFVGDTLKTLFTEDGGVYIDNFLAADTNRLIFTDDTNVPRTFPYVAAGDILSNDNLTGDANSSYWVFFTDANGNKFDSPNAIIIDDNDSIPLSGLTASRDVIPFSYDYENNVQGGRTPNTDAPYTAVSIGLTTGQYVKTTGTLVKSTSNVINFVAALERNYSNPT